MERQQPARMQPVTWGIVLGVIVGVLLTRILDGLPAVLADGKEEEAKTTVVQQAETFRKAASRIGPAVVNIQTYAKVMVRERDPDMDWFFPFYRERVKKGWVQQGLGSGFVFDAENGYILTNNHVVADAERFIVSVKDQSEVEAQLVGRDPQTDIAILKIPPQGLIASVLGDSDKIQVGDWVLAAGNPFGMLEHTVTAGIISAKNRHGLGLNRYEKFLQTDAAINRGNSGGPLVNVRGEVIGINTAIYSKTGGYQGIGFAIPINQAKNIAEKLIKSGMVIRGWMGIVLKPLPNDQRSAWGVKQGQGLVVDGVYRQGPAHRANILPGDILTEFNGKAAMDGQAISHAVADMEPGASIKLKVLRKDDEKIEALEIDVILMKQPKGYGVEGE